MRKVAGTRRELEEGKQKVAFGRAVYLLRIKASLSQEELAFRSGIGRSYVGVLERGEKEPCLGVMYRLAKALNSSFSDICGLAEQLYKDGYKAAPQNARGSDNPVFVDSMKVMRADVGTCDVEWDDALSFDVDYAVLILE